MSITVQIKYFSKDELKCKCGCNSFNMTDEHLKRIDILREIYGSSLIVNSGCRCYTHNKNVGGADDSRHECTTKKADATDLTVSDKKHANFLKLYNMARLSGMFNEVIYYKKSKFVHVATYQDKPVPYHAIIDK